MKKFTFIAAAALIALTACNSQTVEQKIEAYKAEVNEFMQKAEEELNALTDENEQEAAYERIIGEYADLNRQVISKNKNNALSVMALQAACDLECFDAEEIRNIVASLHDTLQTKPEVTRIVDHFNTLDKTAEGKPFLDFDIDGVKLSDFVGKGKYVLVDFWASWCGPCKAELPNIRNVYEKYHGDDFDVLSVAVWDKPEDTVASAEALGIVWNQIINAQKVPTDLYGIDGIPHIILFGPDGTIVKRNLRGGNIEKAVSEALGR